MKDNEKRYAELVITHQVMDQLKQQTKHKSRSTNLCDKALKLTYKRKSEVAVGMTTRDMESAVKTLLKALNWEKKEKTMVAALSFLAACCEYRKKEDVDTAILAVYDHLVNLDGEDIKDFQDADRRARAWSVV